VVGRGEEKKGRKRRGGGGKGLPLLEASLLQKAPPPPPPPKKKKKKGGKERRKRVKAADLLQHPAGPKEGFKKGKKKMVETTQCDYCRWGGGRGGGGEGKGGGGRFCPGLLGIKRKGRGGEKGC